MRINRSKLNLVIDIIMFINMMVIAGIGFLIKYILVPGFNRNEIYGRDVELYYWGLDRHQWGVIHLVAGFVLLFLLLLHIIFHWKMILSIYRNMISYKYLRVLLTLVFIILSVIFGVVPLFLNPEVREDASHHHYRREYNIENHTNTDTRHNTHEVMLNSDHADTIEIPKHGFHENSEERLHKHKHEHHSVEIYGSMTLIEVAEKYKIPVNDLASFISVPLSRTSERLGRLRKEYGFNMDDLRDYVDSKRENKL
jgi:hypothetical protein